NLGMMIRGGITIGDLIHEENGALFGPAMNEAYRLESNSAIYPRVVISNNAKSHLIAKLAGHTILHPIIKSFDGLEVVDLVSIFSWPGCKVSEDLEIEGRLSDIEQDVLKNFAGAHPKIAYLLDRWASYKSQRNKSSKRDAVNGAPS
ncbi:MAG TPA: hypothetical protein VL943_08285, partial [Niabella sp.]|nr:hypothetical protein [Niabella sp.]